VPCLSRCQKIFPHLAHHSEGPIPSLWRVRTSPPLQNKRKSTDFLSFLAGPIFFDVSADSLSLMVKAQNAITCNFLLGIIPSRLLNCDHAAYTLALTFSSVLTFLKPKIFYSVTGPHSPVGSLIIRVALSLVVLGQLLVSPVMNYLTYLPMLEQHPLRQCTLIVGLVIEKNEITH